MGYTTTFDGAFTVTPTLTEPHRLYLKAFSECRRMARLEEIILAPDDLRRPVGLPPEGAYFVDNEEDEVKDYNEPPAGQPGLWCQWIPTEDGTAIVWDGGEKFYEWEKWLAYLNTHFLEPWGYYLDGAVEWQGEETDDRGILYAETVSDGLGLKTHIEAVDSSITTPGPSWRRPAQAPVWLKPPPLPRLD